MAIVKANYQPRAKGKAVKAMGRACSYYTFREGDDQARRTWHGADGRLLSYDQVREEIREHAREAGYSYRIVLSTKSKACDIGLEGYQAVLKEQFGDYYLIRHDNTDFPHAHVIAFSSRTLKRAELVQLRERLLEREHARELEREQQVEQSVDMEV